MTTKDQTYYKEKLSMLRSVIDRLIGELDAETPPSAPRQRRNLKAVRVQNHAANYIAGTWKKPKSLKKAS
jgi:hypothetical protein